MKLQKASGSEYPSPSKSGQPNLSIVEVPASSVPYWSDDCGERFYDVQDMEETFDRFCAKIREYTPRKLIESELSYKVSIEKLLAIFNED